MLKKVVISENNNAKAVAFFEELRAKKLEAIAKIEARTIEFKDRLKKGKLSIG
ncbi:MAG TPA: hypothetical protein VIM07_00305 [Chitinophagaceae bacterium]